MLETERGLIADDEELDFDKPIQNTLRTPHSNQQLKKYNKSQS